MQRLNREGVEAVEKQNYEKAETLFYQAYLFDPADPFTLYNLGYVSELKGQLERAQKLYGLASEQATDAVIDRTSVRQLEGKSDAGCLRQPERRAHASQSHERGGDSAHSRRGGLQRH